MPTPPPESFDATDVELFPSLDGIDPTARNRTVSLRLPTTVTLSETPVWPRERSTSHVPTTDGGNTLLIGPPLSNGGVSKSNISSKSDGDDKVGENTKLSNFP